MPPKTPPSALTRSVDRQLHDVLAGGPSQARLEHAYRLLAKWRSVLIENEVLARQGSVIRHGPFAGMDYATAATEGARVARLLGGYEASLAPIIERIVERGYRQIVDIGCAEGYYAVGLARRMPWAHVLARDTNPKAQAACQALAEVNALADRLEVGGLWTHADFERCMAQPSVVICDIEGEEETLLDPHQAPALAQIDLLVEVHDCFKPGLAARLAARFEPTHHVTRLNRQLDAACLPDWMEGWGDLDCVTALWEWRMGPTPWLWMEKRDV